MNPADRAISLEELTRLFSSTIRYHADMALYLDENIDQLVIPLLREHGIRTASVYDFQQVGERADTRILAKARELGGTLVTNDQDMEEIHIRVTSISGLTHAGIILIRTYQLQQSPEALATALARLTLKFEGFPEWLQGSVFSL